MNIKKTLVYEVEGRTFPTVNKAVDFCENQIAKRIREDLLGRGMFIKDVFTVCDYLLTNRLELAKLLSFTLPNENEEWD